MTYSHIELCNGKPKKRSTRIYNKMSVNIGWVKKINLDLWNLEHGTGSTQGIQIWSRNLKILKMPVQKWLIEDFKIVKNGSSEKKRYYLQFWRFLAEIWFLNEFQVQYNEFKVYFDDFEWWMPQIGKQRLKNFKKGGNPPF